MKRWVFLDGNGIVRALSDDGYTGNIQLCQAQNYLPRADEVEAEESLILTNSQHLLSITGESQMDGKGLERTLEASQGPRRKPEGSAGSLLPQGRRFRGKMETGFLPRAQAEPWAVSHRAESRVLTGWEGSVSVREDPKLSNCVS